MRISFFTLPRDPEYLTATLHSLVQADPKVRPEDDVALYYDALTSPPLPFPLAEVEVASPLRLAFLRGHPMAATFNYERALRWVATGPVESVGLACEDDLQFAERLTERVRALARHATAWVGPRWLLSLHHFYPRESFSAGAPTVFGDRLLRWDNLESFYGSQAMAMPTRVAAELHFGFARHTGELGTPAPADWQNWYMDMGLKNLCRDLALPLFTVDPCLIQHVGDVSVACAGRPPLRNQYFVPRLPA